MIGADLVTIFSYDEADEKDLKLTLETLEKVRKQFEKSGGYYEAEITSLSHTEHIINSILMGETF